MTSDPLAFVIAAGWAALVLAGAARHRPPPRRARQLAGAFVCQDGQMWPPRHTKAGAGASVDRNGDISPPRHTRAGAGASVHRNGDPSPSRHTRAAARTHALETAGALVLRFVPRRPGTPPTPPTPAAARTAGATLTAVTAALLFVPPLVPLAAAGPWAVARHRRRAERRRRTEAVASGLPEVVDLLVVAVAAGDNVPRALAAAARRATGPLGDELRAVGAEVDRGRRLADALDDLPARAGEATRALATVLAGCERYGTAVVPALDRLAGEVRLARQRRAEAAARRVPVTLLFPLVLCILPAFALLTVAPLIAGALRELRL